VSQIEGVRLAPDSESVQAAEKVLQRDRLKGFFLESSIVSVEKKPEVRHVSRFRGRGDVPGPRHARDDARRRDGYRIELADLSASSRRRLQWRVTAIVSSTHPLDARRYEQIHTASGTSFALRPGNTRARSTMSTEANASLMARPTAERRLRNYLLVPSFQLKYTAMVVGVT